MLIPRKVQPAVPPFGSAADIDVWVMFLIFVVATLASVWLLSRRATFSAALFSSVLVAGANALLLSTFPGPIKEDTSNAHAIYTTGFFVLNEIFFLLPHFTDGERLELKEPRGRLIPVGMWLLTALGVWGWNKLSHGAFFIFPFVP